MMVGEECDQDKHSSNLSGLVIIGQTDQFLTCLDLLTNTQLQIEVHGCPSDWRVDSHID